MDVPSQCSNGSNNKLSDENPNEWIASLVKKLIETNSWKNDIQQKNKCYILRNSEGNRRDTDPAIFKITDLNFCIKMKISQENLIKCQSSLTNSINSFHDWEESSVMLTKYQLNYSFERNAENSPVFLDIFFDVEEFHTEGLGVADIDNSERHFPWCTDIWAIRTELLKAEKILGLTAKQNNAETSISDNSIIIDDDDNEMIVIDLDQNSTNEDALLLITDSDLKISNEDQAALDEIAEWKSDYCPLSLDDTDSASNFPRMQTESEDMGTTCDLLLHLMEDSEEKEGSQLPSSKKQGHLTQNQFTESENQTASLSLKRNIGKNCNLHKDNSSSNENVAMEINVIPVCETEEMNENKDMEKALICSKSSSDSERLITTRRTEKHDSASLPERLNLTQNGIVDLVLPEEMTKTLWNNLFAVHRNKKF